ncbi:MAG: BON domain-containing protein [Proteobacteria bacterium]|nr:BON domain-containing protein [Pseudomonadota bacterium]
MTNNKLALLILAALFLQACVPAAVVVTGISVVHDRRSAGQVLDDKIITASVKNELRKSIEYSSRIKVRTYNGVVLMAGEVLSEADKTTAEDSAAIKDGVIKVINELQLVSDISGIGNRSKDKYLSSKSKSVLLKIRMEGFDPTRVKILTTNKTVYLMGLVSQAEADAVVQKIRKLRGVMRVVKVFEYTD